MKDAIVSMERIEDVDYSMMIVDMCNADIAKLLKQ